MGVWYYEQADFSGEFAPCISSTDMPTPHECDGRNGRRKVRQLRMVLADHEDFSLDLLSEIYGSDDLPDRRNPIDLRVTDTYYVMPGAVGQYLISTGAFEEDSERHVYVLNRKHLFTYAEAILLFHARVF